MEEEEKVAWTSKKVSFEEEVSATYQTLKSIWQDYQAFTPTHELLSYSILVIQVLLYHTSSSHNLIILPGIQLTLKISNK